MHLPQIGLPHTKHSAAGISPGCFGHVVTVELDSPEGAGGGCETAACAAAATATRAIGAGGGGGAEAAGAGTGDAIMATGAGAAAICCAIATSANSVASAPHVGHCTGAGMRPRTGSTSKRNFAPHGQ